MSANQVFLIAFAISVIGGLTLSIFALKWGLKWAKVSDVSFLKAFGLYLLITLVGFIAACFVFVPIMLLAGNLSELALNIAVYAIQFIVGCFVIKWLYKARFRQAAFSLITYYVAGAFIVAAAFVIRSCFYEAFVLPTNSMAPTLLGEHVEAACPRCGAPAYGPAITPAHPLSPAGWLMVCSKEKTSVNVASPPQQRIEGDRFLACKFLKPKRWDLIVFRYPQDPSVTYVKRLVGLPGEKLEIRDGAIWINGEKQEPPEAIRGIHYSPTIEQDGRVFSGPGSTPVQLKSDEYFVLGDFVELAADSRMWEQGAPGYPPYAVPESYITGVAINIYWPIKRWTSFR